MNASEWFVFAWAASTALFLYGAVTASLISGQSPWCLVSLPPAAVLTYVAVWTIRGRQAK